MLRHVLLCLSLTICCALPAAAQTTRYQLIPQPVAAQHGLVRAWATQVEFDAVRGRLTQLSLHGGMLFAVSNQGTVQAIDPESGRTVWATKVGRPEYPTTAATANEKYVALCNGSTLYVLNRADGGILLERRTLGVPTAGPVITSDLVYVPTLDGAVEGYSTTSKIKPTLSFHGYGMVAVPPQLAAGNVIWATAKGFVYACTQDELTAKFRFKTRGAIDAKLAYVPPYIITGSTDGYVYAMDAATGKLAWELSVGSPIRGQPVGIEGSIYAVAPSDGLLCLSAERGTLRWFAPDIYSFVAASQARVYASDSRGRLVVLDAKGGARVDSLPTELLTIKLANTVSDRIYLATPTGLLQCLHELELAQPIMHSPSAMPAGQTPAATVAAPAKAAAGEPPATAAEKAAPDKPAAPPPAAGDDKNPFGEEKPKALPPDKPAEKENDPFAKPK